MQTKFAFYANTCYEFMMQWRHPDFQIALEIRIKESRGHYYERIECSSCRNRQRLFAVSTICLRRRCESQIELEASENKGGSFIDSSLAFPWRHCVRVSGAHHFTFNNSVIFSISLNRTGLISSHESDFFILNYPKNFKKVMKILCKHKEQQ